MSGQVPKLGLKYRKLRARKLTLNKINATEINANFNDSRSFHGALISYNKVHHKYLKVLWYNVLYKKNRNPGLKITAGQWTMSSQDVTILSGQTFSWPVI